MHTVAVAEGEIHYRKIGSGPVVLALHGIQGTSGAWSEVGELLANNHTVVAPDLRGREPSTIPVAREAYALDRFAADLAAVVADIGRPSILMGWSMGAFVLFEYLRGTENAADAIVLTGASACLGPQTRWFHGESAPDVAGEAKVRADQLRLDRAAAPHAVAASWWHASRCDYRGLLSSLTIPTLIVHGNADDQCPPEHGQALADRLPQAELRIWPSGGHNLMAHDARRFAAELRDFSRSVARVREIAP